MQVAPIRSPLDMSRAQARITALSVPARGSPEELEYAALREAVEHYRCIMDSPVPLRGPGGISVPDAASASGRQPDRDRSS